MHIVLVEPSRIGQKILTDMLESQQYSVSSFADGQSAYDYVQNGGHIDVLLTAMEVAGMTGLELCWQIRDIIPAHKQLYIIVMSSSGDIENAVMALDSGADDFIRKPPVRVELYAKLRAAQRLISMHGELIRLANFDSLTGLLNRRAFLSRAEEALGVAAKTDKSIGVIMLDIDHFKKVNDTYGHSAGDATIIAVAKALMNDQLIVGRLGGEEFAIVLPGFNETLLTEHAEDLRKNIAAMSIEAEGQEISVTSSFGATCWLQQDKDTLSTMLKRADEALYEAKNSGRNQVVLADVQMRSVAC